MSVANWGLLQKSQEDDETIEEAIARLIVEHNENEEAHTAEGQSLQSHKASEVIDHLANSIVSDKVLSFQITSKQLNRSKRFQFPPLESIDAYDYGSTPTNGYVFLDGVNNVEIQNDLSNGAIGKFGSGNSSIKADSSKNPFLEFRLYDWTLSNADIEVRLGDWHSWTITNACFGLLYSASLNTIRVFSQYYSGGTWHRAYHSVKSGRFSNELWRIEFDIDNFLLSVYIDNVIVVAFDISAYYTAFPGNYFFVFSNKNNAVLDEQALSLSDLGYGLLKE
jgi:hypothetical protein